jgi:hypothetical protein
MSIYKNAINSIELGVEDFRSPDPKRALSATRNIVAGVLLLVKHKLQLLSPSDSDDALIKQRVLPALDDAGNVSWLGSGKKTVDFQQIEERCKSLGINLDTKRLGKIVAYRNRIEHYYDDTTPSNVRELLGQSFLIIRDFLRDELGLDPQEEFDPEVWSTLVDNNEVYERERLDCVNRIGLIDWHFDALNEALQEVSCLSCMSTLVDVENTDVKREDAVFKCRSCGTNAPFGFMADRAVSEFYLSENISSIQDGGDPAVILCPECGLDTYDLEENCCLVCEESMETECSHCSCSIPTTELDGSGICGYCAQVHFKDD